ncbi:MAG: 50S ribosomal protein L22 [Chitinivibrionales bacterium]|nr:50S ribosomal protein L22 [Chitinivibrionales bacterium]
MEAQATLKYARTSPRKAQLVADAIKGKMVGEALSMLDLSIKKSVAHDMAKVVKAAVANMQSKNTETNIDVDDLRIGDVQVGQGPSMRRFRARAQGRVGQIIKRMCHITVKVMN